MALRLKVLVGARSPWAPAALVAMAEAGARVHVVCIENPRGQAYTDLDEGMKQAWASVQAASAEFARHRLKSSGPLAAWEMAGLLRQGPKADHTVCLYGGLFALAARLSGARPYSVYLVGSDVLRLGRFVRPLATWAYRGAQHLIANGPALADAASGLVGRSVESLLLGIDTRQFSPGPANQGPFHWVCARGFLPVYQNRSIVEALKHLPQDGSWCMTFLAGGDELEQCRASAPSNVAFLGGVPPHTIVEHLRAADGFVSFSQSDGTSTAVLEALACGLPGVLSDIPANRLWQTRFPEHLRLVKTDDLSGLAEEMRQTASQGRLSDDDKRRQHDALAEVADSRNTMSRLMGLLGA